MWPDKSIVLLDVAEEVLGGPFKSELKAELRSQLAEFRVDVRLGSPLRQFPPTEPGVRGTFTVSTETGADITADICFAASGRPQQRLPGEALATARRSDGFIEVDPTLQVAVADSCLRRGDISTADAKMAGFAGRQAVAVADNITAPSRAGPTSPTTSPWASASPCPSGPRVAPVSSSDRTRSLTRDHRQVKGRDMMVDRFSELGGGSRSRLTGSPTLSARATSSRQS